MNRVKQTVGLFMSTVMMVGLLAGCGSNNANSPEVNVSPITTVNDEQNTNEEQQEMVYPFTITDYLNTDVVLEQEPERVVTLVPSETEIVFALEAEDKLVGVNGYSDYPAEASAIESIGDAAINVEAVVALEPDLVLASYSMNGDYIDTLRNLGVTVYVSDPNTYDATIEHIENVGDLLNKQEEAFIITEQMREVKTNIVQKVANTEKPNVYLEFSPGWTIGSDTFIDDLITIVGGHNISNGQSGWFEVNSEAVVEANPDVIIYPNFGEPESSILKGIVERPGWDVISAIQSNRLVEVSNEPLVRVGPRLMIGLEQLAKAVHPELFN